MFRVHPAKAAILEEMNQAIRTLTTNGRLEKIYAAYR